MDKPFFFFFKLPNQTQMKMIVLSKYIDWNFGQEAQNQKKHKIKFTKFKSWKGQKKIPFSVDTRSDPI